MRPEQSFVGDDGTPAALTMLRVYAYTYRTRWAWAVQGNGIWYAWDSTMSVKDQCRMLTALIALIGGLS